MRIRGWRATSTKSDDVQIIDEISTDQPAERWPGPDSWSRGCARAKSVPSYASMHRGSSGAAAIGITCSNCVDFLRVIDLDGVYNPRGPMIAYPSA
jgi:hypothetical protein